MPQGESKQETPIHRNLEENSKELNSRLGIDVSFDIVERKIEIAGKRASVFFIDGMIKGKVTLDIIASLQEAKRPELVPNRIEKLLSHRIPYFEVEEVKSIEKAVEWILSGPMVLFVDGERAAIVIDVREFPVRSVQEPDLERVTRGSHEGLVETLIFNTALIRRRLRDANLRFEVQPVGRRSKTDVAVGYLNDVADHKLVERIKKSIKEANLDALPMGIKNLEELLVDSPWNPIPKVRYTERPDVAMAHLLEGHVIILVDTTPMALILPVTAFHFFQHAEEFFQSPFIGTYLRWVRAIAFFIATVLTPLWLALYLSRDSLPHVLSFIGPKEPDFTVPIWAQFLLLEFGLDLIRMALIHTPSALATSLGIVGAILLGDLAVQVGLFVPETILYSAVAAIGYFAIPSIEFAYAVRLYRYLLLGLAAIFRLPGLVVGLVFGFIVLATTRSFDVPYLWPLVPFDGPSLLKALVRLPVTQVGKRPPMFGAKGSDQTRTDSADSGEEQPENGSRKRRRTRKIGGPHPQEEGGT